MGQTRPVARVFAIVYLTGMNSRTAILASLLSTILAACGSDIESVGRISEPLLTTGGAEGCGSGAIRCSKWVGSTEAVGTCVDGACCTGCIDGAGKCRAGALDDECGNSGGACENCKDSLECTNDACSTSRSCVHVPRTSDTVCDSGEGRCNATNGTCCDGVFVVVPDGDAGRTIACADSCPACTVYLSTDNLCLPTPCVP